MKHTISEQALALVEKKLPATRGELTPQDAATGTGITVDEARDALARLMELYVTRVTYDDQGNLLFAFEMPLRRRGTKTAAEKWAELKETLWRGFKVFFKIWIGLMVIVYAVIMAVLLILLMLAQRSSDRDNRGNDRGGDMLAGLFRVLGEGLRFAFWTRIYSPVYDYGIDPYGYRYRNVRTPRGIDKNKKSFIIAIYDLALGPERTPDDPLADEKEVAAFLRAERGVLTPSDIVALSGRSLAEAEERMADYLVRFDGEPTITDEGVVVGEFESFISGTAAKTDAPIIHYWDEYEPPYEHSGNSQGRNLIILGLVAFTLVVAIAFAAGKFAALTIYSPFFDSGAARFLLGYIPIAFSLLYFTIALLRIPTVRKHETERLKRNREKKVMHVIFQQKLWRATADQIYFALLAAGEKSLSREETAEILQGLLTKLQGDMDLGPEGEAIYSFDRIRRELETAEQERRRR